MASIFKVQLCWKWQEKQRILQYEWQLFCQHPGIQGIGGSLSAVDGYSTKIRGEKKTLKLLSQIVTRNCACPASCCFLDHNWFLVTIFHIELDSPSLEEKLDAYSPDACVWTCMIVFACAPCITLFTTVMSLMLTPRCHIESVELCS